jgi:hypothetical protein
MGAIPDALALSLAKLTGRLLTLFSRTLVELGANKEQGDRPTKGAEAFNLVNRKTIPWNGLLLSFVSSIEKHAYKRIDIIPLQSWLDKLKTLSGDFSGNAAEIACTQRGIKLQEFYEARMLNGKEVVEWEIRRAMGKSKTLMGTTAAGKE